MSKEEIIREVISKICPFHGKHPLITIHEAGEIDISACCIEFHKQLEDMMNANMGKPL